MEIIYINRSPWTYLGTTFLKTFYNVFLVHAHLLDVYLLGIIWTYVLLKELDYCYRPSIYEWIYILLFSWT